MSGKRPRLAILMGCIETCRSQLPQRRLSAEELVGCHVIVSPLLNFAIVTDSVVFAPPPREIAERVLI
jgi:hypothetical protein